MGRRWIAIFGTTMYFCTTIRTIGIAVLIQCRERKHTLHLVQQARRQGGFCDARTPPWPAVRDCLSRNASKYATVTMEFRNARKMRIREWRATETFLLNFSACCGSPPTYTSGYATNVFDNSYYFVGKPNTYVHTTTKNNRTCMFYVCKLANNYWHMKDATEKSTSQQYHFEIFHTTTKTSKSIQNMEWHL